MGVDLRLRRGRRERFHADGVGPLGPARGVARAQPRVHERRGEQHRWSILNLRARRGG
mgnify:CR=1 FL=1